MTAGLGRIAPLDKNQVFAMAGWIVDQATKVSVHQDSATQIGPLSGGISFTVVTSVD